MEWVSVGKDLDNVIGCLLVVDEAYLNIHLRNSQE